jgi:hypothetical protein
MRWLRRLALVAALSGCAAVETCPDPEKDGGIGGTGECTVQTAARPGGSDDVDGAPKP